MSKARDLAGIFNLNPTSGTTAQRPATADVGEIYYNGTTGKTQIYTPTGWQDMASGIPYGNTAGRPAAATGQPYFNGETARLELYTAASGWQNIVQETPGVSSINGAYLESTNSGTITIHGTNFVSGAYATAIGTNGVQVDASSTTYNSLVQLTAVFTGLSNQYEPYDIKVTNPSNLFGILPDALYINAIPVWQTTAGSLGIFAEQVNATLYALSLTDDSTITYALASGSTLPSGVTLNSSTGVISGTLPDILTNTTYNFTVNASDGANPVVPRSFSITSNAAPVWTTSSGSLGSFLENTSINVSVAATDVSDSISYGLASGSFLPSGITLNSSTGSISGTLPEIATNTTYTFTVNATDGVNFTSRQFSIDSINTIPMEYLVVGGGGGSGYQRRGGGGAGGMLTGTRVFGKGLQTTITVGNGGAANNASQSFSTAENSVLSNLVAFGGGCGAADNGGSEAANGRPGGSGGGGLGDGAPYGVGGAGTVGQGNNGGSGQGATAPNYGAGGGGGAGAVGGNGNTSNPGDGGIGLQSSITGTATYYAGGGGGGYYQSSSGYRSNGGLGGGGRGAASGISAESGSANTGGGGGGGYNGGTGNQNGGAGGSGIVVLAYPDTYPALTDIPGSLTYNQPSRSGYRVYRFTAGSGTVTF